jgi:hypothetical protein
MKQWVHNKQQTAKAADALKKEAKRAVNTAFDLAMEDAMPPAKRRPAGQTLVTAHFKQAGDERLDAKVSMYFYECAVPFNTARHSAWLEMVEEFRPGYKAPTSEALRGPLLVKVSWGSGLLT